MATARSPGRGDPREIVRLGRRQALALADRIGAKQVDAIMREAATELEARLRSSISTGATTPTSQREMAATLLQLRDVIRTVSNKVGETALDVATDAANTSAASMFDYLQGMSSAVEPGRALPIREASMFSRAVRGAETSILRRLATTDAEQGRIDDDPDAIDDVPPEPSREGGVLSRYSIATIGEFENVLRRGMLTGKPWGDVRDELTRQSPFLQGSPKFWAERIVRTECLLADTPVSGAVVRAVFRRWYEGPVVEIITKGGRKFTATPNHPMLTRDCWVGAGSLRPGDDLVCYVGEQNAGAPGDQHIHHGPATIGEIFDALSTVGIRERRRTTQPDFHGDGAEGDVDVLRPFGPLSVGRFAPLYEPTTKRVFSPTGAVGARFCRGCRRLLSAQEQPCFCGRSNDDSRFLQTTCNELRTSADFLCEFLGALSARVLTGQSVGLDVHALPWVHERIESIQRGLRAGSQGNPRDFKRSLHDAAVYSQRRGDTGGAHSGEVQFDRVVSVRWLRFSGHVFNLETPYGYFAINGAYTGNTMGAYNRAGWEAIRAADDELGDMVKILSATFDDRTGWDSYQVHGQIRLPDEAFSWNGGLYQSPPNRPNDREVVVPHRIAWPIPDELSWRSDAEVAAAWRREQRRGAPPPRPVMTTVSLSRFGAPSRGSKRRDVGDDTGER